MNRILNALFTFIKIVLLFACFGTVTYISLMMYRDLNKNILTEYLLEFSLILLPFILLIFIYFFTLIGKNKVIINNLYFNFTNFIALLSILLISLRSMFDKNMIEYYLHDVSLNYNYFTDYLPYFKVMLYALFFSHILLLLKEKLDDSKNVVEEDAKEDKVNNNMLNEESNNIHIIIKKPKQDDNHNLEDNEINTNY